MTITITPEFESALKLIRSGKNVLITGKAGTGKSTLLHTYLNSVRQRNVLVTAPTGVAALNVNGFTIHRAFGFWPGIFPDDLKSGGNWQPKLPVISVIKALDVLVIDEISMVRADLFDMIDIALRRVRKNDEPFGGVQLILVGDLLQLPPVVTLEQAELFTSTWTTPYFFSAHCYQNLSLAQVTLTTVWRQTDDEFIEVLNQVREGSVGDSTLNILNTRVDPEFQVPDDWVTLASHRQTVEKVNYERLNKITNPQFTSQAIHSGETDSNSFSGSEILRYAVGARVMTIINDPSGFFVNGSFGTVMEASTDFISVHLDHNEEVVKLGLHTWEMTRPTMKSGSLFSEIVGTITQFPVILAWAITIHKAQGKTIPKLFIDLARGTNTEGQFYVALSRGVTLDTLKFNRPVEKRHALANNSLVRRIRREVIPVRSISRLVFLSLDGVSFGITDHIARLHVIILEDGNEVANFGSWINSNSDLGYFGKENNIPSGGMAMTPTLRDFWPLLLRQAAGGIVIGDRLPMLERAIRYQERGMDLALGIGYDITEFGIVPKGSDVVTRCQSMVTSYLKNPFNITHGQHVPKTSPEIEGALFIPQWADQTPVVLDPTRATDSDHTWAAFSGAHTDSLNRTKLAEIVTRLSTWAISRGAWNLKQYEEIKDRARRAGVGNLDITPPVENTPDIVDLLVPDARIAFTGLHQILGCPVSDDRLRQLCHDLGFEFKSGVSKTRCDLLIAHDPASMSRKAQKAREYGTPIISLADFEEWCRGISFSPAGNSFSSAELVDQAQRAIGSPAFIQASNEDIPSIKEAHKKVKKSKAKKSDFTPPPSEEPDQGVLAPAPLGPKLAQPTKKKRTEEIPDDENHQHVAITPKMTAEQIIPLTRIDDTSDKNRPFKEEVTASLSLSNPTTNSNSVHTGSLHPESSEHPSYEYLRVTPEDFLQQGTRVVFRGSTRVNGKLYAHGPALQALCDTLGLIYKKEVTQYHSDVLITTDLRAHEGKMKLAIRYQKPLIDQEDFSNWAGKKLTLLENALLAGDTSEDNRASLRNQAGRKGKKPPPPSEKKSPKTPKQELPRATLKSVKKSTRKNLPRKVPIARSSIPQEILVQIYKQQIQNLENNLSILPVEPSAPQPQTFKQDKSSNKATVRLKKWGIVTLTIFWVGPVLGIIGLIPIGVVGILVSLMALIILVFGIQALVQERKK